ncbi:MAG TPA: TolC family protein [Lacipirellulaceae bacterium]|nr:TolC family protein [Lacipirellulaceae bacterium]
MPRALSSPRTLSLREAIDVALLQNPDVVTARAAVPVALAARGVAATYPWNPNVQVGVFPYARDEAGNLLAVKNQVAVMQTLELAHQPQYRQQAAMAEWQQERSKITQAEWTAVTNAMRSYFTALYKKSLLDLARESAELGDSTAGVVNRRFAAGIASPAERITANVAARRAKSRAELAEADYQTALQSLRIVLNAAPEESIVPSCNLQEYRWLPIMETMGGSPNCLDDPTATADATDIPLPDVANRPDVEAARHGASAAEANLDLAKANRMPNLATGPSYERDEAGTVFIGLQAQIDLPIWNTGAPLVHQRAEELQQQLITWRQTRLRAACEADAAAKRYQVARGLWSEHYTAKNSRDDEFRLITDAFEHGQASIMDVLATRDNLIQERQANLDLLGQVSQAAVDVVSALAIDPETLIEAPSGTLGQTSKQ